MGNTDLNKVLFPRRKTRSFHFRFFLVSFSLLSFLFLLFQTSVLAHQDPLIKIESLNQKLENRPEDVALTYRRALAYFHDEQFPEALKDLNTVLKQAPDQLDALVYRGLIYHKQGENQRALGELDTYIKNGKPFYLAFEARASVKNELGNLDGAIDDYTQAIGLRPRPEHFIDRGQLYYQQGYLNDAIVSYEKGLRTLGETVPLVLKLVDFQVEAGLYDEALDKIEEIKIRAPRQEEWLLKEAEILGRAGRQNESEKIYQEVLFLTIERDRGDRVPQLVLLQRVRALIGLDRHAEAKDLFSTLNTALEKLNIYQECEKILSKYEA